MTENYYVYEWFNVESQEVFYVGKGKGDRYKNTRGRNQYFSNYIRKHNVDVRKIHEGLSEESAFNIEKELIAEYKKVGQCKTNLAMGGQGLTLEKNTWMSYFRSLQFQHQVSKQTLIMPNHEDYHPDNLRNLTLDEIEELYEDLTAGKDGVRTFNQLLREDGWEHCWDD
ncbi:hypothetical protein [Halobacillus litoralis]|uniref:hypothetical protein n=1 Tax=Halobacillus litoralis TaxID=45668 RepID=UPI001CD79BB5|nr:hypothetical protein [Halobacillus litoralis]MCA1021624.1 hypothetical protein [Halobacillus litoralis]